MARRAKVHGPTTKTVSENVRRFRKSQGMSVRMLSERTVELGHEIPGESVQKIEASAEMRPGARHVSVDELMVLAVALNVSPVALLLPCPASASSMVDVTGAGRKVQASEAWAWGVGSSPLATPGHDYKPHTFRENVNPPWADHA